MGMLYRPICLGLFPPIGHAYMASGDFSCDCGEDQGSTYQESQEYEGALTDKPLSKPGPTCCAV